MKSKKTISRKGKKLSKIKRYNKMSKKRMKSRKSHSKKSHSKKSHSKKSQSNKSYSKKSYSKKSHSKKSHSKKKKVKRTKMRIRSGATTTEVPTPPNFHSKSIGVSTYTSAEVDMLVKRKIEYIKELKEKLKDLSNNPSEKKELEKKIDNNSEELKKLILQLQKEKEKTESALKDNQKLKKENAIDKDKLLKRIYELEKKNENDDILTSKQEKELKKLKKNIKKAEKKIPWKKVVGGTILGAAAFIGAGDLIDIAMTDSGEWFHETVAHNISDMFDHH